MTVAETLKKLFRTGFFHIFVSGTINKVLSALLSIILVRILSKGDYGSFSYAFNIASFFILFNGMGASSAFLQIGSELYNNRQASDRNFAYSYRVGIITDIAMVVAILAVGALVPLSIEGSNYLLMLYCAYPLFQFLVDLKQCHLRVDLHNKEYALMTNIQTVLNVVLSIVGAIAFQAPGLVLGQTFALIGSYAILCIKFPFRRFNLVREVSRREKRDFWGIASVSAFNNAVSSGLTLIGTFLIGLLLSNPECVASYKVATTIPFALIFIPSMLVTYFYPYFARHKNDKTWTIQNYRKLILLSLLLMGSIAFLIGVFAEPITIVIFGEEYHDAVLPLQLLMVGFFVTASFRVPTGNLLVTQRKLISNAVIGVFSIMLDIVLSYLLIPDYGMLGAASVYDLTMLIGAVANTVIYIRTIRRIPNEQKAIQ